MRGLWLLVAAGCVDPQTHGAGDSFTKPRPPATVMVTGRVYGETSASIAGASIASWVWTNTNGSWSGRVGPSTTADPAGHYDLALAASGSVVKLSAMKPGFQQPCITQVAFAANSVIDVPVHSDAYIADPASQPPANGSPVVQGFVYENGVPAANVWVDADLDDGLGLLGASTHTASNGHYWICRVPTVPRPGARIEAADDCGGTACTLHAWATVGAVDTPLDLTLAPR